MKTIPRPQKNEVYFFLQKEMGAPGAFYKITLFIFTTEKKISYYFKGKKKLKKRTVTQEKINR